MCITIHNKSKGTFKYFKGYSYQSTTFTQVHSEWVPNGFGLIPWTSHSVKDNTITILEMKGKH